MKRLKIENQYSTNTTEDIAKYENQFSIKLPNFLKIFFLEYGYCRIYENWSGSNYYIGYFLPLYSDKAVSAEQAIKGLRYYEEEDELSIGRQDLIPIAMELSNRYFCVSIGKDDYGQVYLTEWVEELQSPLRKIADTFEGFISDLKRDEVADKEGVYSSGNLTLEIWVANYFINKDYST
jgi:SMI1 / KNR4 family (SUKH-1)